LPAIHSEALLVAGLVWLSAFGIFVLIYGPMLVGCGTECLLSGVKRTFPQLTSISAFDPKRTFGG
jgi:hypothetical protein